MHLPLCVSWGRSGDNLWELIFSFYCVGLGHVTQIMRSGDECSYLLSFLAGPKIRDVL